jgi:hypothetical protein
MLTTLSDGLRHYLAERYPGATISDFQFITSGWESDIYEANPAAILDELFASSRRLYTQHGVVDSVPQQAPIFEKLARRIQFITGLTVPELERVLGQIK